MSERHVWVPYAAIAAGSILLLESILIISSEDTVNGTAMVTMYFTGLLLALAAAIGTGLRQRKGRRALVAVGCVVALVVWVMSDLVAPVFEAMSDAPWVGDEGPIGLLGAVLVALGARTRLAGEDTRAAVGAAT
jgi:hypothetical protein